MSSSIQTVGSGAQSKLREAQAATIVDPNAWDGDSVPETSAEGEAYCAAAIALAAFQKLYKDFRNVLPGEMSFHEADERADTMSVGKASQCEGIRLPTSANLGASVTVGQVIRDAFNMGTKATKRKTFAKAQSQLRQPAEK